MNFLRAIQATLFSIALISIWSCQTESNPSETLILGHWDIEEATRNGRPTESLAELFFEFFQDGKMRTNLSGIPDDGNYTIEKDKLYQRESQMDTDYTIEEINDSLLILSTEMRGFAFRFLLQKSIQEK